MGSKAEPEVIVIHDSDSDEDGQAQPVVIPPKLVRVHPVVKHEPPTAPKTVVLPSGNARRGRVGHVRPQVRQIQPDVPSNRRVPPALPTAIPIKTTVDWNAVSISMLPPSVQPPFVVGQQASIVARQQAPLGARLQVPSVVRQQEPPVARQQAPLGARLQVPSVVRQQEPLGARLQGLSVVRQQEPPVARQQASHVARQQVPPAARQKTARLAPAVSTATTHSSSLNGQEWSNNSRESIKMLREMQLNPNTQSLPKRAKMETPLPSPSKATLALGSFRRHRREASQPVPVEVVDLSEDLPDLECVAGTSGESYLEDMFRKTGNTIVRCLQSLAAPAKQSLPPNHFGALVRPAAVVSPTRPVAAVQPTTMSVAPLSSKLTTALSTVNPNSTYVTPSLQKSPTPPPIISPVKLTLSAMTPTLALVTSTQKNANVATITAKEPISPIHSVYDDNFDSEGAMVSDDCIVTTLRPVSVFPNDGDRRLKRPTCGAKIIRQNAQAPPSEILPVLKHLSISPNAGSRIKAPPSTIIRDLQASLVGMSTPRGPDVPKEDVPDRRHILSPCLHILIESYFKSSDQHAVNGVELLSKLSCHERRPSQEIFSRMLDFLHRRTPNVSGGEGECLTLSVMRYLRQAHRSGYDSDLPLWEILQAAGRGLEVRGATVTIDRLELCSINFVLQEVESDVTRLVGGSTGSKLNTARNFSPDAHFVRLTKILDWIVNGLLALSTDNEDEFSVAEMLVGLSQILALSLCFAQDYEKAGMRLAEGFCSCFPKLPNEWLRRRLLALVRPRMVRCLCLSLLLERYGDRSTLPSAVERKYASCKLCIRKAVKFYFRMRGLTPPLLTTANKCLLELSESLATPVDEFMFVLVWLLETYALLLQGWWSSNRNVGATKIQSCASNGPIVMELARLNKMGSFIARLEVQLRSTLHFGRPNITRALERLRCLSAWQFTYEI